MPRQLGIIIDSLIGTSSYGFTSTALQMLLFLLYCSLASHNVLGLLQGIFWLPYEQHAARSIKAAVHRKIICLSRDFQTKHNSGESMRSIGQVTNVIWLLRKAICLILPSMLDILLSGVYLSYVFGTYITLVFCVTATLYTWAWTHDATKRVNAHRSVLQWDRNEAQEVLVLGLMPPSAFKLHLLNNFRCESIGECETMNHFGGQVHQSNQPLAAVNSRHFAQSRLRWRLFQSSLCQEVIKRLGLAVASALVLYQIFQGTQSIGNFAMMIVYSICAECTSNSGHASIGHLTNAFIKMSSTFSSLLVPRFFQTFLQPRQFGTYFSQSPPSKMVSSFSLQNDVARFL